MPAPVVAEVVCEGHLCMFITCFMVFQSGLLEIRTWLGTKSFLDGCWVNLSCPHTKLTADMLLLADQQDHHPCVEFEPLLLKAPVISLGLFLNG